MQTMDVESTNKDGEVSTYTGVSLNTLLEQAGLAPEASTLVFVPAAYRTLLEKGVTWRVR